MRILVVSSLVLSCSGADATLGASDASDASDASALPEATVDADPAGIVAAPVLDPATPECRLVADDGSICACRELGQRPTTLYLLLDRSGSMAEHPAGSAYTKWSLVRSALVDREQGALRRLGARIAFAMAWFPHPSFEDACAPGRQVLGLTTGSPTAYDVLDRKLASARPAGATPTAAALTALLARLPTLPPPVSVLLATDGAPTCGATPCEAAACSYNLEGRSFGFRSCDAATNCCDPATTSAGLGWKACVDAEASVAAAAALARAGAKVFVLGAPGTVPAYRAVLEDLARAGGSSRFYETSDGAGLAAALSAIAAEVIDSCTVSLEAPVVEPGLTHVLVDGVSLPQGSWTWSSSTTIELLGEACTRVHAGLVSRIQVVVGCRTLK